MKRLPSGLIYQKDKGDTMNQIPRRLRKRKEIKGVLELYKADDVKLNQACDRIVDITSTHSRLLNELKDWICEDQLHCLTHDELVSEIYRLEQKHLEI